MSASGSLAYGDDLASLRERKRLFDDVWLLTLFVIFLAIAIPWFLRILDVELGPLAWSLFGFGLVYLLGAIIADRAKNRLHLILMIGAVQGIGIVFLGYVWHLAGGLQNPTFLLAFGLPIIAGGLVLVGWQSYATAFLGMATVSCVALIEAPELRWYLLEIGLPLGPIIKHLPQAPAGATQASGTLIAPASYLFVLLELFGAFLLALALLAESLNALLRRLYVRLGTSMTATSEAEMSARDALEGSPYPALWVVPDSFGIERTSASFLQHFGLAPGAASNANLFDLVAFSYPDVVEGLIAGNGGEYPLAIYRIGGETRVAHVRVRPIRHDGRPLAHVTFEDLSNGYLLRAVFDAADDGLVIVSSAGTITHCNPVAARLLPALQIGGAAASALDRPELPKGWWELEMRRRMTSYIDLEGKRFRVQCVAHEILGEADKFTILTLRSTQDT